MQPSTVETRQDAAFFGAIRSQDGVRFRVWASSSTRVQIQIHDGAAAGIHPLADTGDGVFETWLKDAAPDNRYSYILDGGTPLPDPASRFQPDGVHGPSQVVDPAGFAWTDERWRPWPARDLIVYEIHVGTFSPEGTFKGVEQRLPYLRDLGITTIEIMPVADFAGARNWGYDGVALFAPARAYGTPDDLRRLVNAAHAHGLSVMLDVVYNHLGPEGAYLPQFSRGYLTGKHQTPWGAAVNLDDEGSLEVRRWIIENALMWLRDYHVDALRLDAVHALEDDSPVHVLAELSRAVDALSVAVHRPLTLIAESDLNQPRTVTPVEGGGLGMTAQWSDDFHHALHALLTGESQGYYADFAADPYQALVTTLTGTFFHDGRHSSFRGADWGATVDRSSVPGWRFLGYLQTHDQVGNRATGDRIGPGNTRGVHLRGPAELAHHHHQHVVQHAALVQID